MHKNNLELDRSPDALSLHRQLVEGLSMEFAALEPGSLIPSAPELRSRFNVAYMTINKALDELAMRHEIVRIRGKGSYTAARREEVIWFLIPCPETVHRWTSAALDGALDEARKCGIRIKTLPVTIDNNPEHIDWDRVKRLPEAASVIVSDTATYRHMFRFLQERRCQVALLDPQSEGSEKLLLEYPDFKRVRFARVEAVEYAIILLRQAGCRRILLIHHGNSILNPVRMTFRKFLSKYGEFDPVRELFLSCNYQRAKAQFRVYLDENVSFDGIVSYQAIQTIAARDTLEERGIHIPEDISLVGLEDDQLLKSGSAGVSIVTTSYFTGGAEAVKLLSLPKQKQRKVPFTTILRNSIKERV